MIWLISSVVFEATAVSVIGGVVSLIGLAIGFWSKQYTLRRIQSEFIPLGKHRPCLTAGIASWSQPDRFNSCKRFGRKDYTVLFRPGRATSLLGNQSQKS